MRIGALDVPYYLDALQSYLPRAEIVKLDSPGDFFRGRSQELDVLAAPVSIGMAHDAKTLADFINAWLSLKREDKTLDQL